jgi:hypothetical protein
MRAPSIIGLMLAVTGLLLTNTATAQFNPFPPTRDTSSARPGPVGKLFPFPDYQQVFGYIAAETGLGKADDMELAQRLNSSSSIDHLHDYSGESIIVVKPELLGTDDKSRVQSALGNYPFFVFREMNDGYVLLGEMEGRSYEWSIPNRHLQFLMTATAQNHRTTSDRYEVNQAFLVNLTELAKSEKHHDRVVIDAVHSLARVF